MFARLGTLRALAAVGLTASLWAVSCSGDGNPEVSKPPADAGDAGGAGGDAGSWDGSGGNGATDAGSDADPGDAAVSPLRLGIVPVPPSTTDAGPSPGDEKLAQLDVIALGSRGVSQVLTWKQLFESPAVPAQGQWEKLQAVSQLYQSSGRSLLVCLALVDRTLDARPAGGAASWADSTTVAALDALIDKVLSTFGSELYAVSFGNELDRYFASHDAQSAAGLAALVEHGIGYAKKHPKKLPSLLIGATFSAQSLTGTPTPTIAGLLKKADVAVTTYYPLDATFAARPPSVVAQDLDALESLSAGDAEPPRPILLQEVGYPSAAANKSSPDQQKAFYQALTQALTTRRARFPFVSINGLNDRHPAACASEAAALGAPDGGAAVAARCSLGLRAAGPTDKPAMASVLEALAAFSAP
ncbi:MAG: hypothetical protein HYZ29_21375 [Myxococcales bacterium]|nr:hypothetical protein [Myxococcales bacterium]